MEILREKGGLIRVYWASSTGEPEENWIVRSFDGFISYQDNNGERIDAREVLSGKVTPHQSVPCKGFGSTDGECFYLSRELARYESIKLLEAKKRKDKILEERREREARRNRPAEFLLQWGQKNRATFHTREEAFTYGHDLLQLGEKNVSVHKLPNEQRAPPEIKAVLRVLPGEFFVR